MEKFARPQAAISAIRVLAHETGLTAREFDSTILPALDSLVKMEIQSPSFAGNDAGYDIVFTVDEEALNLLLAPWRPLDLGTLYAVQERLKNFRQHWAESSSSSLRLPGIDSTLLHVAALIREVQEKKQ